MLLFSFSGRASVMAKLASGDVEKLRAAFSLEPDLERPMRFKVVRKHLRSKESERQAVEALAKMAFQDVFLSYNTKVKICVDGDSWCNLLWPVSGYPKTLANWLSEKYYLNNLAWPGDTLGEIYSKKDYRVPIKSGIFDFFIVSAGGVDFFSQLDSFVKPFSSVPPGSPPMAYLNSNFKPFLSYISSVYSGIVKQVVKWSPTTKVVLHGYDYSIPVPNGKFLGRRFKDLGYSISKTKPVVSVPARIVRYSIDEYYRTLEGVKRKHGDRVIVVDCIDACKGRWHDEIHGNATATKEVARRFAKEMGIPF